MSSLVAAAEFRSKSYHKISAIHYMFIVETVTNRGVCTSNDVRRAYFGTSPWLILGLLWTSKNILSRAELLLKLENYKSVDHKLHFSRIKTGSKISFHRHFNNSINVSAFLSTSITLALYN